MAQEKFVNTYADPKFVGDDFRCEGVKPAEASNSHPANKGEIVGKQIRYVTRDEQYFPVDDRAKTGLRGCRHYQRHTRLCTKDGVNFPCPVAGVVNDLTFEVRMNELQVLVFKEEPYAFS